MESLSLPLSPLSSLSLSLSLSLSINLSRQGETRGLRHSFPYRFINIWNGHKKDKVQAKTINEFKAELDNMRYED